MVQSLPDPLAVGNNVCTSVRARGWFSRNEVAA
jgi:hypothetical protein